MNINKKRGLAAVRRIPVNYENLESRQLLATVATEFPLIDAGDASVPTSVLEFLQTDESTQFLAEDDSSLQFTRQESIEGHTTTFFQQHFRERPIYGAEIAVIHDQSGQVFDSADTLVPYKSEIQRAGPLLSEDIAIDIATSGFDLAEVELEAESVWYFVGSRVRPATHITFDEGQAGQFELLVNSYSGEVLLDQALEAVTFESLQANSDFHPFIVINDESGIQQARKIGFQFDAVAHIDLGNGSCSGTLIAPNVVLTARHCGVVSGDNVTFGDNTNAATFQTFVTVVHNPGGNGSNYLQGDDISLIALNQNVPSTVATPMRLTHQTSSLVGSVASFAGYGVNGLESTGPNYSADGLRWGGQNVLDVYFDNAAISYIFLVDFDDGTNANNHYGSATPLPLEAAVAPGDSGGALLVELDGEWVIAGVTTGSTSQNVQYGVGSFFTSVEKHSSVIELFGGEFI